MKYFIIIKNNLQKKKSDTLVIFLLVVLATLLLYVSISVLTNMGNAIETKKEKMNGADVTLITSSTYKDKIISYIRNRKEVSDLEVIEQIYISGVSYYRNKEEKDKSDQIAFSLEDMAVDRNISKLLINDEGNSKKENGILLPYYMKTALDYKTGDIIYLKIQEEEIEFEVCGFTENVLFTTPMNIPVYKCYISDGYMAKIKEICLPYEAGYNYQISLKEGYDSAKFDGDLLQALGTEIPDYKNLINLSINYKLSKVGTMLLANIIMAVVFIFSFLLIFIALVILRFSIQNAIDGNLKNIGMMQALGYTSGQLIATTLMETFSVASAGIIFGLVAARAAANVIGNVMGLAIGIQWSMKMDGTSIFLSAGIMILLIILATFVTALKFRKMIPLHALREGVHAHSFRKNHVELHKSRFSLSAALGFKDILNQKKKTIAVSFIIVILAFACNIGLSLYQNFVLNREKIVVLSGLESSSMSVQLDDLTTEEMKELEQELLQMPETEEVLFGMSATLTYHYKNQKTNSICDVYEDTDKLHTNTVAEGRYPEFDNEVMLSSLLCKELGVTIGDVIYLELNGERADYLLVGISQHINNLGRKGMITFKGIHRLNEDYKPAYLYIYGKEGATFEELKKAYKNVLKDMSVTDEKGIQDNFMKSIETGMTGICTIFIISTLLIIFLVIYLLIKTKLIREKRMLGVQKALGFTTGQLMKQTIMSYLPVIFSGAVAGTVIARILLNSLVGLVLSFCGINRCEMDLGLVYMAGVIIGILLTSVIVSTLCSFRIRKIMPYQMIQEQ